MKRTRHVKTKYGVTKVEDDQPIYALLRAIDLDTRLENFQNYLLYRDSWCNNKAPSPLERAGVRFLINTPTLQQQVNILIAQATQVPERSGVVPIAQRECPPPTPACGGQY